MSTFNDDLRKAVATNKADITKVFNEAYNNDQAIKVLDANQADLTKAVQYLEDQNAATAKKAKAKVPATDTTIAKNEASVTVPSDSKTVDDADIPSVANSDFTNMVQKESESNVNLIMAHVEKTVA